MTPNDHAAQRLQALQSSGLLDSAVDPVFDRMTRLATAALRVPVALISLVDEHRQFFLSQCGLPEPWATDRETPLSHSFCQHVATRGEPLIISDAREHPLVMNNLAIPDIGVIAYAGVPIVDNEGFILGSLCAIDGKPKHWSPDDVTLLKALAAQFSAEVQFRMLSAKMSADLLRQREIAADQRVTMRLNIHDLRTPLTAMLLGIEAIEFLGPLNDDQAEYIALSKRNGQSLLGIVNNLLDIAMIEQRGSAALHRTAFKPAEIVRQSIEQVQQLATAKSIQLSHCVGDGLPDVFVDNEKVTRVVVNLLGNAIKFTDNGGHITLNVHAIVEATGMAVQFSVQDNGIGMKDGTSIFDEGVKLDPHAASTRSTGLGLTFCKRTIDAHGGRIWFESQLGHGSTFYFTVPTIEPAAASG